MLLAFSTNNGAVIKNRNAKMNQTLLLRRLLELDLTINAPKSSLAMYPCLLSVQ